MVVPDRKCSSESDVLGVCVGTPLPERWAQPDLQGQLCPDKGLVLYPRDSREPLTGVDHGCAVMPRWRRKKKPRCGKGLASDPAVHLLSMSGFVMELSTRGQLSFVLSFCFGQLFH